MSVLKVLIPKILSVTHEYSSFWKNANLLYQNYLIRHSVSKNKSGAAPVAILNNMSS
jgi:hypothetical protein